MQGIVLLVCLLGQAPPDDPHLAEPVEAAAAEGHFDEPRRLEEPLLVWWFRAMGPIYTLAIFGSGLLLLIGAVLMVLLARPPVIAAYLALVPIPFLIGLLGIFQGMIASFRVIAMAMEAPKPSEIAEGISTALSTGLTGTMVVIPTLLVVGIGLIVKTALMPTAPVTPEIYGVPPQRV